MRLLLDAGNTRLKWGCLADGRWLATGAEVLGDDAAAAVERALDALPAPPREVLACSVAGAGPAAVLTAAVARRWGLPVSFATATNSCDGLRNGYRDPAQLGVDRWLAMLGAFRPGRGACCIVDAGTAITVDLVDAGGDHRGGFIMPGFALLAASLAAGTDRLGRDLAGGGPAATPSLPGRDTAAAVHAGSRQAAAGLVERACRWLAGEARGPVRAVYTGGDAAALLALAPPGAEHRPLLVLEGLARWAGAATQAGHA